MSTKPVKFSEHFGIDKDKLKELGVFDPILNHDTKLFTEPLMKVGIYITLFRMHYSF